MIGSFRPSVLENSEIDDHLWQNAASVLGRPLNAEELQLFNKYLDLLIKWHKTHRLIGSTDRHWIIENLLLDSLLFLRVLPRSIKTLLDFGSGAGLPGIPLKIVRPEIHLTLLEAKRHRASFLRAVVRELQLRNCEVVNERAETVVAELSGIFDAVVLRCAGSLSTLLPIALRLIRPSGVVVASGPPHPTPLQFGEWASVPGIMQEEPRSFFIARKSLTPN